MFSDFSSFGMYPQHTALTEQSSLSSRSPLGLSKADVIALGSSYKSYMAHLLLHLTRSDFCASCHRWLSQGFHPALMCLYAPVVLAGLSANALYSHCRLLFVLSRHSRVHLDGVLILPPSQAYLGISFLCGFCS